MSNDFLPKNYNVPEAPSRYMKFGEGANKFRILSSAITGWEWWTGSDNEREVHRVKLESEIDDNIPREGDDRARHFWSCVVWNRKAFKDENDKWIGAIQILQLTQKSIMTQLKALLDDEEWGSPKEYDITITKTKTGPRPVDVEYTTMPGKPKNVEKEIVDKYKGMNVELDALYKGDDPFSKSEEGLTDKEIGDVFDKSK